MILDRYLARQILTTTFFAVTVLCVVLVLGNLFKKFFDLLVIYSDVPIGVVLRYIAFIMPFSLVYTIPWALLTAVLLVFGRLSADHELLTMRMAGMSMVRICWTVFGIAGGLSALCLWINVSIAPRMEARMDDFLFDIVRENPNSLFSTDKVVDEFPQKIIYVESKEADLLRNVQIYYFDEEDNLTHQLIAKRGSLRLGPKEENLYLDLEEVQAEARKINPETRLVEKYSHNQKLRTSTLKLSLKQLYERKAQSIRPSIMTSGAIGKALDRKGLTEAQRSDMRTEINKRYSFSLACLAFALIGVPLGVTAQRRETSVGFALSLIIGLVYFFFIIAADFLRKDASAYPHLIVWLPNVIFLSLGVFLFWRLNQK